MMVSDDLLFPDPHPRFNETKRKMINLLMKTVIEAFDQDKDKRLNFTEWKALWKSLGFRKLKDLCEFGLQSWNQLLYLHRDLGLFNQFEDLYRPSLSTGLYGSYPYGQLHRLEAPISLGPKDILQTLKVAAYIKSRSKRNVDYDFRFQWELSDEEN